MKVNPDAAGLDAARLERITSHFQERYIDAGRIAGAQVLVARHGSVGYFRSFGLQDRERNAPVSDETIWRIYSMSKPITSVALMALYEHGLFALSDPVHRYIPEWNDLKVSVVGDDGSESLIEPQRPMSVRDVLMHTSGLSYGGDPSNPVDRRYQEARLRRPGATLEDFCAGLADIPLKFHPGTRWHYSYSTDVCGRLVEVLSGKRFDTYLDETIFGPLGMTDTHFQLPSGKVSRFAANYARRPDKSLALVDDPEKSSYLGPQPFLSGGGGLVSTTADYHRFCEMLRGGGELEGTRILGRKTLELMASNHLPGDGDLATLALGAFSETAYEGVGFGLGFAVGLGPARQQSVGSAGEFYWGGAASTIFWVDPVEDLVVILMTQLMPSATFDFRGQLKRLVYPAIVD